MCSEGKHWIINRSQDSIWFTGSAAAGFILLLVYYLLTELAGLTQMAAAGALYILWAVSLDASHIFAMYSRTYFDREFMKNNSALAKRSLVLLAFGPALVLGHYLLLDDESVRAFALVFNYFGLSYAYYHLCRQHWGIMMLYNKKANEDTSSARKRDAIMLTTGLIYPLIYAFSATRTEIHHMSLAERLPVIPEAWATIVISISILAAATLLLAFITSRPSLAEKMPNASSTLMRVGLIFGCVAVVVKILSAFGVQETLILLSDGLRAVFMVTLIWYATDVYKKFKKTPNASFSKEIFIVVVLLTNNIILHQALPLLMFVICLTIFHNLQYHRIVRFYNTNQYSDSNARSKHGISAFFTSRLEGFILAAFVFSLIYLIPKAGNEAFNTTEISNYIIMTFFWGIAFHHYYIDSIIWKAKKVKSLNISHA